MGITCKKLIGKNKSYFVKMVNEQEKLKILNKLSKPKKKTEEDK